MNTPTTKPNKILLVLSLGIILFITWRVLVIGMSEYYVARALDGDKSAIKSALSWNASHPKAQFLQAQEIIESDPARAEELLRKSLLSNPTDIDAIQAMARVQLATGNREVADKLITESTRLAPADKMSRLQAGVYWARIGQWQQTVAEWDDALTTSPEKGKEIFPILMQLAQSRDTEAYLNPLIEKPPVWWTSFIEYLAKNANNLDTVLNIAALRMKSSVPLTAEERKFVVRRMMKDGEWPGAYITWVNGLDDSQRGYLGSVYDGSFLTEPTNEGFDWHVSKIKGVSVRRQRSYGSAGEKALQLTFDGRELIFKHLYQSLYLTLGKHEFIANVKTDRLSTRGGLAWVVRCAFDEKIVLGESARMLGSSEWREVRFIFDVPNTPECAKGQILRLESTGQNAFDHKLNGEIWFDRVAIRSIRKPLTTEEKAAREKAAQEKAAQEKAALEKAELEKAEQQAAREKAAREKAAREKAAREKAEQQAAREKAAREKAAREKAAREKAEQQAALEKAAREKAEQQAALEKAARERAEQQAALERAAREKAEQQAEIAREKAAREKAAREQAAIEIARQQAEDREKFVIELPAEAATQLTDNQLNTLIRTYVSAYNAGNLEQMTGLFADTVETDDGTGIEIIKKDYSKLFNTSEDRRITVQNVQWKKIGENAAIINFIANIQVLPVGSKEWKKFSGDMQLQVSNTEQGLQINGSTHSVKPIE